MSDGYLSTGGNYVSGESTLGRLMTRSEIVDDHPDYAETLATGNHRVIWYGMTSSELIQAAFSSFADVQNWRNFLAGAASYPADIGWFGYGLAAATGAVGPSASQRVRATGAKVWEIVSESANVVGAVSAIRADSIGEVAGDAVRDEITRQIRDGALDAARDQAINAAMNPRSLTKLAFLGSVYLNYLATGGAYAFAGRNIGGKITKNVIALLFARGVPQTQLRIVNSGWFTWPMLGVVTAGSIVRLGEKQFDRFGSVENLDLLSILVGATTGEDDPEAVSAITRNIYNGLRDQFRDLAWDYERDALERRGYRFGDEVPERIRETVRGTINELEDLADIYSVTYSTPTEDTFYNFLIRAHSMCVRLQREGVEHPVIDKMVGLADPTILHFVRLLAFSVANVVKHINTASMVLLREYDFWSLLEGELAAGEIINNPNYDTVE